MDFLNTDFDYQNPWNAYLPTSQFLPFLVNLLDYQVMDLHDLVMEKSWKVMEFYCTYSAGTLSFRSLYKVSFHCGLGAGLLTRLAPSLKWSLTRSPLRAMPAERLVDSA